MVEREREGERERKRGGGRERKKEVAVYFSLVYSSLIIHIASIWSFRLYSKVNSTYIPQLGLQYKKKKIERRTGNGID